MSFEYKRFIEEGDLVLAFISRGTIKPITIKKGETLNTRYGHYSHDNIIGKEYGTQMPGDKGYGFIHLLLPTPELWTLSLPHRTQIVYTADASYIVSRLDISTNSVVLEAGTGSGSFTHSLSRSTANGQVYTYEFHEPRFIEAKSEIVSHGIKNVHITHRDVCNGGFDINREIGSEVDENVDYIKQLPADAIFLDLPSPWEAIPHLDSVIAPHTAICCFSPCIEQVDKTVKALQDNGWTSIEMVEVSSKRWEARKDMVRDVKDVVKKLKDIQQRKSKGIESRRVAKVKETAERRLEEATECEKAATEEREEVTVPSKRNLQDDGSKVTKFQNIAEGFNPWGKGLRIKEGNENYQWTDVTKIESEIKTHTSYLTFAVKIEMKKQD